MQNWQEKNYSQLTKQTTNFINMKEGKITVLVGGCFDILHPGHVIFLEQAKRAGDRLIVMLESDEKIKKIKGVNRPVHNQKERALVLKALKFVDSVILLPFVETDEEYEAQVSKIAPDVIAVTKNAPDNYHKVRVAKKVGAKLRYVTKMIRSYSTTRLLEKNLV